MQRATCLARFPNHMLDMLVSAGRADTELHNQISLSIGLDQFTMPVLFVYRPAKVGWAPSHF